MRLSELNPKFLDAPTEGRTGVGVDFDCPCGACGHRLYVPFSNPLDGGCQYDSKGWLRGGETFEDLNLVPSILRKSFPGHESCGWHGYITNGEIITV